MIVFPNAKINIGLNVIEKRKDGFHNIESCFFPVPWYDALEVIIADELEFNSTGISIPGEGNICLNAYDLLKSGFDIPNVRIHLHKNIPVGAGLGGGSADGAFMLKLLNDIFSLGLSTEKLQSYASQLGSDCPFFIENEPSYVEGTGNIFSRLNLELSNLYIAVIYPEIHVETQSAYSVLEPNKPIISLKETLEDNPISSWKNLVTNAFEANADTSILKLKEELYNKGALYSSMTGSGSAVYGLFKERPDLTCDYPKIISTLY
jgi:4-diphosphocytidyl-2-C-methyl-D-erythritol kinase